MSQQRPPQVWETSSEEVRLRKKGSWVCFGRRDWGLCPGSYKRPDTELDHPNIKTVTACCGEGRFGFPGPHPVLGGSVPQSRKAKFAQLSLLSRQISSQKARPINTEQVTLMPSNPLEADFTQNDHF